jgi:hypothetical protein
MCHPFSEVARSSFLELAALRQMRVRSSLLQRRSIDREMKLGWGVAWRARRRPKINMVIAITTKTAPAARIMGGDQPRGATAGAAFESAVVDSRADTGVSDKLVLRALAERLWFVTGASATASVGGTDATGKAGAALLEA